jgi:hypothetical protein
MDPSASQIIRLAARGGGILLVLLCAACATTTRRPVPPSPPPPQPPPRTDLALEARCRNIETAHGWKRSAPPGQPMRSYFTVPAGATAQLWFEGRNDAVALCTPCARDPAAVQSFEWYEPGFRKGELKLLKCAAAGR